MDVEAALWQEIDKNWRQILKALRANLPTREHQMFTESGEVVESNRPMVESILADKVSRSPALFYYLAAAGLANVPNTTLEVVGETNEGGKIYAAAVQSKLPLTFSGSKSTAKAAKDRQSGR